MSFFCLDFQFRSGVLGLCARSVFFRLANLRFFAENGKKTLLKPINLFRKCPIFFGKFVIFQNLLFNFCDNHGQNCYFTSGICRNPFFITVRLFSGLPLFQTQLLESQEANPQQEQTPATTVIDFNRPLPFMQVLFAPFPYPFNIRLPQTVGNPYPNALQPRFPVSIPPNTNRLLIQPQQRMPDIDDIARVERRAILSEPVCTWRGLIPPKEIHNSSVYSRKVFCGGVPTDVTDGESSILSFKLCRLTRTFFRRASWPKG